MLKFGTVLAICCLGAAKAAPSQWGSSSSQQQLDGVPDLFTFGKITFPKYDLLDLGEYSKDHLPGDEIKVTKESKITIPQPYPVKIPIPQPYPVHIEKPYPVHETKIIKVPVPVPQIVEKKVPYPVEVPKPYPVHIQDHSENGGGGGGFEIHQALEGGGYGVQEEHAELPSNEGYEGGIGGGNFNPYETKALEGSYEGPSAESGGWQPIEGDEAGH